MKTIESLALADSRVIDLMVDVGADLSVATEVNHYVYFPSLAAARRAGTQLRKRGFIAAVQLPTPGHREWCLVASQTVFVSDSTIGLLRASMERLASESGGRYDGWEAVVPPQGDGS